MYKQKEDGQQLHSLIPVGKNPDEFIRTLGKRFKNVCCAKYVLTRVASNTVKNIAILVPVLGKESFAKSYQMQYCI